MYQNDEDFLECQTCGCQIKSLTMAEAQKIASNPYGFIIDCYECRREEIDELARKLYE